MMNRYWSWTGLSRLSNLLAFIVLVVVNGLASSGLINGRSPGDNSEGVLTPLGAAFGIWGLIYILMALFIVYQLLPSTLDYEYINIGISPFFIIQVLFNVGWLLANAYSFERRWVEVIFILLLSLTLCWMYVRTQQIIKKGLNNPICDFIFGRAWLSFYVAWVIGATCVNCFVAFSDISTQSYMNAAITLGALGVLALIVLGVYRDGLFGFTLVWTSIWIAMACYYRNTDIYNMDPLFISASVVASVVFVVSVIVSILNVIFYFRLRRAKSPEAA